MTVDDVSNTFGCIERIYLFNKRLFYQLDRALLNIVQVSIACSSLESMLLRTALLLVF